MFNIFLLMISIINTKSLKKKKSMVKMNCLIYAKYLQIGNIQFSKFAPLNVGRYMEFIIYLNPMKFIC